ncbi:MAG: nicotinate-nucleotide adenylyltransferase [bacterium]|jgi:nicotinate-nucleotide adenylyltransferase|nr:nicotinate-nucleotide adenylyltransferase [bacterium]
MHNDVRVGLFGGSFDPIHNGHLELARWTKHNLSLDQFIFIPAATPPHKQHVSLSEPEHRLRMVQLAIKDWREFEVSDFELHRKGISYTIDTIDYLRRQFNLKKASLFLVIGADSLVDFHTWRSPARILRSCHVVVLPRPDISISHIADEMKKKVIILAAPLFDISSTEIRKLIKKRQSINHLVPEPVAKYIVEHKLYR